MSKQLGFSFDTSKCSGCMACIVACQDQNDLPGNGIAFRHVTRLEKGRHPEARIAFLSLSCLHCGDAPCLMVCPTGAIFRREHGRMVDVNRDLCVGCPQLRPGLPFRRAPSFWMTARWPNATFAPPEWNTASNRPASAFAPPEPWDWVHWTNWLKRKRPRHR